MIPKNLQTKDLEQGGLAKKMEKGRTAREIGTIGEKLALRYLEQKGYKLVTANYYIRGGELDLVMMKNGILIFVEVKIRTTSAFGEGAEAITMTKKRKLLRTIFSYLDEMAEHQPWQLDVISLMFDTKKHSAQVKHFHNILVV